MSLSGINPNNPSPLGNGIGSRNDINGQSRVPQQQRATNAPKLTVSTSPAAPRPGVTHEAPPGTDPALWSILTNAEREHFAASGARGPLTYGAAMRGPSSAPATARGGRLDVKA